MMLKKLINKIIEIIFNIIPIILMILLVPIIEDDFLLTTIYVIIITSSFLIKYEDDDNFFFIFGFIIMTIAELIFIKTGVEIFIRNSLFGIMPLWLPFLWGYCFVVMKRGVGILKKKYGG